MRHFVLTLLFTVALPATAEAPQMRYMCQVDKLIVQISVQKAGVYTMVFPSDVCGPSI